MKNLKIVVGAMLVFAVLAGIGIGLTPPPPPPPPVNQNIGIYDTGIDHLQTTGTDQGVCRVCHQTSGTNISGGYANTIGGVPTRHHKLVQLQTINPETGFAFACTDCHPSTPGVGSGILIDRSCVVCHNGSDFYGNGIGARVGNFSRPHHVNTSYDDANIGNPAAARQCKFCHGSFVNNYNDGHFISSAQAPGDLMIQPFATFKVTNTSQPDGLGGNKVWGGCLSCHDPNPAATPMAIDSNHDTHHKEILGFGRFGGQTPFQNASTPFDLTGAPGGRSCFVCHVTDPTGSPLRINITNPWATPAENLIRAMELRNSSIEATSGIEPGTTNITFNGTGCEKCHGIPSLHNIQYQYQQNGPQGLGHINNNLDCSGCHDAWLPANSFVPGAIVPYIDSISPSTLVAGTATTVTITGSNFVNDQYTSVVTVDGVTYTPTTVTDTQIVVGIPALTAGTHQLAIVKGGDTLSKLSVLTVVPGAHITSAKLRSGVITIQGTNFGTKPAVNSLMYVSANHAGNQIQSSSISSWTTTTIKVRISNAAIGDVVTVLTADGGESTATIARG